MKCTSTVLNPAGRTFTGGVVVVEAVGGPGLCATATAALCQKIVFKVLNMAIPSRLIPRLSLSCCRWCVNSNLLQLILKARLIPSREQPISLVDHSLLTNHKPSRIVNQSWSFSKFAWLKVWCFLKFILLILILLSTIWLAHSQSVL